MIERHILKETLGYFRLKAVSRWSRNKSVNNMKRGRGAETVTPCNLNKTNYLQNEHFTGLGVSQSTGF
jgi:hypothetical protein